ncbi:MAG: glycine cleavage system protein GcvH [Deltaproteobacteria bacterium]|nr:glycine cleavage system protein GcvH [Deltaproteobacteria bacterium]
MTQTSIPEELRYSSEHEWVKIEGDLARVGITDHAQQQLGDITYVELPEIGRPVERMGVLGTIESVKAAADFYAPLSGAVAEVNTDLEEHPEWVNQDCYGRGWLVQLTGFKAEEWKELMTARGYSDFLEQGV